MSEEGRTKSFEAVFVTCPYCGNRTVYYMDRDTLGPQVILCDIDDSPGCDRYFAVHVKWQPNVTTFRLQEVN